MKFVPIASSLRRTQPGASPARAPISLHGCGFGVKNNDFLDFLSRARRFDHGIVHSGLASMGTE
jgi:hypothetical protein